MSHSKTATLLALALSAALAGTGCLAQPDGQDERTEGQSDVMDESSSAQAVPGPAADEVTGETAEACGGWGGGGWGGRNWGGGGWGGGGWGGRGWGGFSGCGFSGWGHHGWR